MLRLTARIDLDDVGHTAVGGLHLAAMGSVWRALAIDPVLAPGWDTLELRLRFHNSRVHVRPESVEASADPPVAALGPDEEHVQLDRAPKTLSLSASCPRTNA